MQIHSWRSLPYVLDYDAGPVSWFPAGIKIYDPPVAKGLSTMRCHSQALVALVGERRLCAPACFETADLLMTTVQSATQTELQRQANDARNEASNLPPCKKRDILLEKARELDSSANLEGWLNSSELQPPRGNRSAQLVAPLSCALSACDNSLLAANTSLPA
jgi:hypothetical protein